MVPGSAAPRGGCAAAAVRCCCCCLLCSLSLAIFLVFHSTILEPYFDLSFSEIEVTRQLPALLLGHICVVEEFLLQLQCLELGIWLPLLPHRHGARPFLRDGAQRS